MRRRVYGVGDTVAWGSSEQGIHWVEHLSGDNHVPLPQKAASVLSLLPFKHNIPATRVKVKDGAGLVVEI